MGLDVGFAAFGHRGIVMINQNLEKCGSAFSLRPLFFLKNFD
jgi:hypothetical protein